MFFLWKILKMWEVNFWNISSKFFKFKIFKNNHIHLLNDFEGVKDDNCSDVCKSESFSSWDTQKNIYNSVPSNWINSKAIPHSLPGKFKGILSEKFILIYLLLLIMQLQTDAEIWYYDKCLLALVLIFKMNFIVVFPTMHFYNNPPQFLFCIMT